MKKYKAHLKKFWWFIWEDDSLLSWIVNIVLAFILIKFLVYPGLGFVLGTDYPVVAVVSGSMEHKLVHPCIERNNYGDCIKKDKETYEICGNKTQEKVSMNLDNYWSKCGSWYDEDGISKEEFKTFIFKNGFNTGDIIILLGKEPDKIKIGDVIVFGSNKPYPIIHRVISKNIKDNVIYFETKGDHNPSQGPDDKNISEDRLIGKAVFKIPYLGWIKIGFFEMLNKIALIIGIKG